MGYTIHRFHSASLEAGVNRLAAIALHAIQGMGRIWRAKAPSTGTPSGILDPMGRLERLRDLRKE